MDPVYDSQFFDVLVDRSGTGSIKWDRFPPDVLPMWVADMDLRCPLEVSDALRKRAEHEIYGYSVRPDSYFEAIVVWLKKRFDWEVSTDQFAFCAGIVQGCNIAIQAFSNPGDYVILQPPIYYPFFWAVENNGRRVLENRLKYEEGRYSIDWEDLEKQLSHPQARIFMLCSPHNPVARVWTTEELERIDALCMKHDVMVVADEIHSDLVLRGHHPHTPFLKVTKSNAIAMIAPSKTFNVAGFFNSFVLCNDKKTLALFEKTAGRMGVHWSNSFAVTGTEACYRFGEKWLEGLLDYLSEAVNILRSFLKEKIPEIKLVEPEGTYLIWLDCNGVAELLEDTGPSAVHTFFLEKAKVGMNDGHTFGSGGSGFVRMNVGTTHARLIESLERMEAAVKKLRQ